MAHLNGGIGAAPGRKLRLDPPRPIKCDGDFEAKLLGIATSGARTSLAAGQAASKAGIRLDSIPAGAAGWTLDLMVAECMPGASPMAAHRAAAWAGCWMAMRRALDS
jgi:hypothetical protein